MSKQKGGLGETTMLCKKPNPPHPPQNWISTLTFAIFLLLTTLSCSPCSYWKQWRIRQQSKIEARAHWELLRELRIWVAALNHCGVRQTDRRLGGGAVRDASDAMRCDFDWRLTFYSLSSRERGDRCHPPPSLTPVRVQSKYNSESRHSLPSTIPHTYTLHHSPFKTFPNISPSPFIETTTLPFLCLPVPPLRFWQFKSALWQRWEFHLHCGAKRNCFIRRKGRWRNAKRCLRSPTKKGK